MEKIKLITTATMTLEAGKDQWWEKTKSGKTYRLWDESNGLLRLLKSIPAVRIYWAQPF